MLTDWELWACANQVHQSQGENAPLYVAEQLGALALAGDADGIRTWQEIARRIQVLRTTDAGMNARH